MPSHYAHYQFGKDIVKKLPGELKLIINKNIDSTDAFIVGLQGPDPLYFHNTLLYTRLNREAAEIHHSSGMDFFRPACIYTKENGSSEVKSYLLGSIAHYVLDSACHPLIINYQKKSNLSHSKVERELDNYIIERNGMNPLSTDLKFLLPVNNNLGKICSPFYKTTTVKSMNDSINTMRKTLGKLKAKSDFFRYAEYYALSLIPPIKDTRDMVVMIPKNHVYTDEYYERNSRICIAMDAAVSEAIFLMQETLHSIEAGSALSKRFLPDFLGKIR